MLVDGRHVRDKCECGVAGVLEACSECGWSVLCVASVHGVNYA